MNATPTADATASLGHLAGSIVGPGDPFDRSPDVPSGAATGDREELR